MTQKQKLWTLFSILQLCAVFSCCLLTSIVSRLLTRRSVASLRNSVFLRLSYTSGYLHGADVAVLDQLVRGAAFVTALVRDAHHLTFPAYSRHVTCPNNTIKGIIIKCCFYNPGTIYTFIHFNLYLYNIV